MSEHQLTPAMVTVLKSWGWIDIGNYIMPMGSKWYKYERKMIVAQGGDGTWDMDVVHARALTQVIDLLEGMGWELAADVEAAKLLAAEEVWVPTMKLRRQLKRHNHTLQQKWLCPRDGSSEWRTVPTVDEEEELYA